MTVNLQLFQKSLTAQLGIALLCAVACLQSSFLQAEPPPVADNPKVQILKTPDGIRYGLLGTKPHKPAPTLIVLASTPENTLGDQYFLQCGVELSQEGYLCVSLDLPCHGADRHATEPEGLEGWRYRSDHAQDFMKDFVLRAKSVIETLIAEGFSDPHRIIACGTSRGGFSALHLAAQETRIRSVAAFAPVIDLSALREFKGDHFPERTAALSALHLVDRLADRNVWVIIGDRDERVGTDHTVTFARSLSQKSIEKKSTGRVDLLVFSEPRGHTTPLGAPHLAAKWFRERMAETNPTQPQKP